MKKDYFTAEMDAKTVESDGSFGRNYLKITSANGNEVRIYMPGNVADAMADAWAEATNAVQDEEERYWTSRESDGRYTEAGLRATQEEAWRLK